MTTNTAETQEFQSNQAPKQESPKQEYQSREEVLVEEKKGTLKKAGGHLKRNWKLYVLGVSAFLCGAGAGYMVGHEADDDHSQVLSLEDETQTEE